MGLDMYLYAEKYISGYDYTKDHKKVINPENQQIRDIFPEMIKTDNLDSITIRHEVGYWRKANHIHKWFVDNCQDGNDDCRDSYVSREQLKELLELCKQVVKDSEMREGTVTNGYRIEESGRVPILEAGEYIVDSTTAQRLLPTEEGFFFGSTDYDQWYMKDIELTIEIIERCLKLPDDYELYYHSSW